MTSRDALGHPLSGASPHAIELYEQALHELRCFIGDPLATVDRALARSPGFTMAHVLRAYLNLLGTEPAGIPVARTSLEAAEALGADARERGHCAAVRALVENRWHAADRILEDVAIEQPRDSL